MGSYRSLENDPVDANGLANDSELKRTLEASREDRRSGRMYSGQTALEMLRKINRENQEGANLLRHLDAYRVGEFVALELPESSARKIS